MKTLKTVLSSAAMALTAVSAQAFEFHGGEIGLRYADDSQVAEDYTTLGGGIDMRFGQIGLAFDVTENAYSGADDVSTVGAHIYYAINQQFAAGFYLGQENWEIDGAYDNFGVEVAYDGGRWGGELFHINSSGHNNSYSADLTGVTAFYEASPNIRLTGQFTNVSGDDEGHNLSAGAHYTFGNGLVASLGIARDDYDGFGSQTQYTLGIKYVFGEGMTFGRRDFVSLLPAY